MSQKNHKFKNIIKELFGEIYPFSDTKNLSISTLCLFNQHLALKDF
jgi:hypothetical protein